jgi:hypothetical protein
MPANISSHYRQFGRRRPLAHARKFKLWSHDTPPRQRGICGHKAAGYGLRRREVALQPLFSSASRDDRLGRPVPRASSRPAMSWPGFVSIRARSQSTSRRFVLFHGISAPSRPLLQPEPADAFPPPGDSRSVRQFRQGGPSFFPGSFSLSLAAPPAGPPLCGRGMFGSP